MPFFITLAHEFLHALYQLECVDWLMERNEDFSNPKSRLQDFLMEKLELKHDDNSLQEKFEKCVSRLKPAWERRRGGR